MRERNRKTQDAERGERLYIGLASSPPSRVTRDQRQSQSPEANAKRESMDSCMDLSGIAASEVELGGISMDEIIIEHRSLIMIARV